MENKLTTQELYAKKKVRYAAVGLIIGILAGIFGALPGVTGDVGRSMVWVLKGIPYEATIITIAISSMITVGLADFFGGFVAAGYAGLRHRNVVKEMKRTLQFKPSYNMLIGTFIAGPVATTAALASFIMAGITVGSCMLATCPLIVSLISKVVLKEKLSVNFYIGACLLLAGAIVSAMAALEKGPLFIPGIICGLVAATGFATEAVVSTRGADFIDEFIGCMTFRCFGSGIMCSLTAIILSLATGSIGFWAPFFTGVFQLVPWVIVFGAIMNACQYISFYGGLERCGPARTQAMIYTQPIFTIPIGLAGTAIFGEWYPYAVSIWTIIGALVVVCGTIMIVCRPKELLQLRDN